MADQILLKRQIEIVKSNLRYLKNSLNNMLISRNELTYNANLDYFVPYIHEHYLQLSDSEQQQYCQQRALYCLTLHQVACLYEEVGCPEKALVYHLKAILRGYAKELFTSGCQLSDQPPPDSIKPLFFKGLAALLGINQPKNVSLAKEIFIDCIKQHDYRYHAHLFLGLIHFYGLKEQSDLKQAASHFNKASKANFAIANQYKGLCQIEAGKLYRGKRNIGKATKEGLPLSQTTMAIMYEHGYGMFHKHPGKANKMRHLAEIQNRIYLNLENQRCYKLVS